VFLADNRGKAKVCETSQRLGGNVGTVLVVTKVFSEQLFAPVRSGEARFNRYLRYKESPKRILDAKTHSFTSNFSCPVTLVLLHLVTPQVLSVRVCQLARPHWQYCQ